MKHLKKFENINADNLKIGDYVTCSVNSVNNKDSKDFILENIGRYVKYLYGGKDVVEPYRYVIEYENVPYELRKNSYDFDWENGSNNLCIRARKEDILMWSSNRNEIENANPHIMAKKYNI